MKQFINRRSNTAQNPEDSFPVLPPGKVAIVIAGRNSEKYLDEAIKSAIGQTIPCEIVYVDDCSSDASLQIAYRYLNLDSHKLDNVHRQTTYRILPSSVHTGVCETRNRGALATRAPYIIFMDTDDTLPPTYAADCLQDANSNPSAPFIYPSTKAFGGKSVLWRNLAWLQYDMWQHNQVSTTSMWSRQAFLAAGMWDRKVPSMWDYDLAIRCSRFGLPFAGKAILNYRIHDESQSALLDERTIIESIPYKEMIRRKNATLGIACLYSGRLPGLFPRWVDKVACSVRYAQDAGTLQSKPRLLVLCHDSSHPYSIHSAMPSREQLLALMSKHIDTFSSVELMQINYIMPLPDHEIYTFENPQAEYEKARRQAVSTLLAKSSALMQATLGTDITWFVEDDIIVPMRACQDLFLTLTGGNHPPIAASGTYYSRHMPTQVLGGFLKNGKHFEPHCHFAPEEIVDFCGTGCMMFWSNRPGTPKWWRPRSLIENATAHDWAWAEDRDGDIVMLGKVTCDHMIDEETPA